MKENKQKDKKKYEKPVITKHGQLIDITAQIGTIVLGCPRF